MVIAFYFAAFIVLVATVLMLSSVNAVHALLYLIVSLLAAAVVFYTVGAPFVAAMEAIVYAGAVMVLFVFVVMLLNLGKEAERLEGRLLQPGLWLGPSILSILLAIEVAWLLTQSSRGATVGSPVGPGKVSQSLFGTYLIGVELASMLLLGGLVAAYHLGTRPSARKGP